MLEKLDLTKKLDKKEYKERMEKLAPKLGKLQRACKELGIPVMIAFEGYDAAGKGLQIGELIQALDPRGFEVYAVKEGDQGGEDASLPVAVLDEDARQRTDRHLRQQLVRKVLIDGLTRRSATRTWRRHIGQSCPSRNSWRQMGWC